MVTTTPRELTRRSAMVTIAAACCCSTGAGASAPRGQSIDQITDLSSTAAGDMFRFEPELVRAEPGTLLEFLNSRGDHTVHSVPQLWPAGTEPVKISHKRRAEVAIDRPGLYGFRCQRHGKYGMVMLVVAGPAADAVGDPADIQGRIEAMRAGDREKGRFRDLIERAKALG
ncbi:MAG: plastocyanin/azurin family copper-binding protein [Pseudomonadota bacterium]